MDYKEAGVDLEAADAAGYEIARLAKTTFTPGVLTDIGLFGGFFELDLAKSTNPVLVASMDGVGTKLSIAFMAGIHNTIGQDLVNHCVNDIMTSGAEPLFFLDYFATGKLESTVIREIISGIASACKENKCALIGGETAEMPGFYRAGEYDVAGCIIGVVDKKDAIDGTKIKADDILIGLPSSGLHTNGFSLARKVIFDVAGLKIDSYLEEIGDTVGAVLLAVHRSYRKPIQCLRPMAGLHGISHITGGGIVGNTKRLLSKRLQLMIDWHNWSIPPIFTIIQNYGGISENEMRRVFNLGIGIVFIVAPDAVDRCIGELEGIGEQPMVIGKVFGH